MLGVDSASARPCFDGTTRGLLESNFWVVTACGHSYLALVCVGFIWRQMRDKKSSVCENCCDARGHLLVPFLAVFLALVVVSAGKGAWSSPSVATWVGFASNMTENAESQTGGISAAEVGRKRRIAAQGWLTRASKRLETVVAQPEIDLSELFEQFDSPLTAYDSAQSEFELYLDSDQLIAEIDKSADYRDNVRVPRIAASKHFASPIQNDDKHSDHAGSNASSSHVELNLPYFGGDVREWTSFWEQFETAIDDSDLPDVSKFTYLRSLLKCDAKHVSRVSLCLVRIIPLHVICWKNDMVGRNKLFSLMCRTCWIYLFLPNVLLNSCGSWMISCWHMSGHWSHLGWVELNTEWYWLLWLCRVYRRIYVLSGRARVRDMKVTSNGLSHFSRVI